MVVPGRGRGGSKDQVRNMVVPGREEGVVRPQTQNIQYGYMERVGAVHWLVITRPVACSSKSCEEGPHGIELLT